MIIAQQVEHPVNQQRAHLGSGWNAAPARLPRGGVQGDHHVAEHRVIAGSPPAFAQSEGQDVCRPICAAVVAIEQVHLGVADQTDRELRSLFAERREQSARVAANPRGADAARRGATDDANQHH